MTVAADKSRPGKGEALLWSNYVYYPLPLVPKTKICKAKAVYIVLKRYTL